MGCGLATDDRSREEGRHYTDESAVRLHGCGACGKTKGISGSLRASSLASQPTGGWCSPCPCSSGLASEEPAKAPQVQTKKKGLEIDLQALKR